MEFRKRSGGIGSCIRLQNYCIDSRIETQQESMKLEGLVEVIPGQEMIAPLIIENGIPFVNLQHECRCPRCANKTQATKSLRQGEERN